MVRSKPRYGFAQRALTWNACKDTRRICRGCLSFHRWKSCRLMDRCTASIRNRFTWKSCAAMAQSANGAGTTRPMSERMRATLVFASDAAKRLRKLKDRSRPSHEIAVTPAVALAHPGNRVARPRYQSVVRNANRRRMAARSGAALHLFGAQPQSGNRVQHVCGLAFALAADFAYGRIAGGDLCSRVAAGGLARRKCGVRGDCSTPGRSHRKCD